MKTTDASVFSSCRPYASGGLQTRGLRPSVRAARCRRRPTRLTERGPGKWRPHFKEITGGRTKGSPPTCRQLHKNSRGGGPRDGCASVLGELRRLASISLAPSPGPDDVVLACQTVIEAMGARDAFVLRSGDPHFLRIGSEADATTYAIKQRGLWLIWQALARNPDRSAAC